MFMCIKFTIFCCLLKIRRSSEWYDKSYRLNHFALAYILILYFMLSKIRLLFHRSSFFFEGYTFPCSSLSQMRNRELVIVVMIWCCQTNWFFFFRFVHRTSRSIEWQVQPFDISFSFCLSVWMKVNAKTELFLVSHLRQYFNDAFFSLNSFTNQIFQVKIQRDKKGSQLCTVPFYSHLMM